MTLLCIIVPLNFIALLHTCGRPTRYVAPDRVLPCGGGLMARPDPGPFRLELRRFSFIFSHMLLTGREGGGRPQLRMAHGQRAGG